MPFSLKSRIAPYLLRNGNVVEVIDVYDHLFELTQPAQLPNRIVLTGMNPNAEFCNLRDNIPQCDNDQLPKDQRITYDEIQGIERDKLYAVIAASPEKNELWAPFDGPAVVDALMVSLSPSMRPFAHWLAGDFEMLFWKRFAWGDRPGIIEDILQTYRAGYFVYGWTGTYPNDIKLLAFPGRTE